MKKILLMLLILATLPLSAYAEFYRLYWYPPINVHNEAAGRATYFDIHYSNTDGLLKFYVVFEPKAGKLPDGFQLAINNGPNPKGRAGELAFIYFDASNPADLKLTAYGYNGINMESWSDGSESAATQPPDKIFTTEDVPGSAKNPAGWVKEIDYLNDGSKAIFLLTLNTNFINSHTPLYPDSLGEPWEGMHIGAKLGMWFHPIANLTAAYGADGFLTSWSRGTTGWYDTANQNTTPGAGPRCEGKIKGIVPPVDVKLGQLFFTSVIGEGDGQILNPDIFTVTYSGVPGNASFTIPASVPQTLPVGGGIESEFNWIPGPEYAGQTYVIDVTFTNQYNQSVSCPFALIVPENIEPVCDSGASSGSYQNLSCAAASTTVTLNGTASNDPDNTAGIGGTFSYNWTSNCPGANFDNAASATPKLTFSSETGGIPVSCTAFLTVSDGFKTSTCQAAISVSACQKDCAAQINGTAQFDICGVCQGNEQSCLDCAGNAFGTAKADRCGVCNGNGTSCLDCSQKDIAADQLTLDSNAGMQNKLIKKALRRYKHQTKGSAGNRYVKKTLSQAALLSEENWVSIWTISSQYTLCGNNSFCVSTNSNQPSLLKYVDNSKALNELLISVIKRIDNRNRRANKFSKSLSDAGSKLHADNITLVNSIPQGSSSCS